MESVDISDACETVRRTSGLPAAAPNHSRTVRDPRIVKFPSREGDGAPTRMAHRRRRWGQISMRFSFLLPFSRLDASRRLPTAASCVPIDIETNVYGRSEVGAPRH
jgi:hypothetical protein